MKLIYLGTTLDSSQEIEIHSKNEFGFKVTVTDNNGNTHIRNNCTEVHHLYTQELEQRIAFESDIHFTGGTKDVNSLSSVVIELQDFLAEEYYS